MSAEIIQFSTAPRRSAKIKTSTRVGEDIGDNLPAEVMFGRTGRPLSPPATETAKNSRIRTARRDVWRRVERTARYWLARADWVDALESAQRWKVADSASLAEPPGDRMTLIRMWREAIVKQLLTPAPDTREVAWKRAKLEGHSFSHLPVTRERVELAIADDVAFLAAHPTRRDNSAAMARRREHKEAMRQRIRDVAASRDLSREEIKPALGLRHQAIAQFSEKYRVNLEWLLEGRGRVFKTDPIVLNENSTGREFAEVVRTLPTSDQRTIEGMVAEMLKERSDEAPAPIPEA
jgi:hypothetical protein